MAYLTLILIALAIIILFIVFKTILKAFFKLFFIVFIIIAIVSSGVVYLVARDVRDFQEKFTISDNLVLLEDNSRIISGFIIKKGGELAVVDDVKLQEYGNYYSSKDYNTMLASNYKLIIIKIAAFDKPGNIDFNGQQHDRKFLLDVVKAEKPVDTFLAGMLDKLGIALVRQEDLESKDDDARLKAAIFATFYTNDLGTNPVNIALEYKKGNILVYPETIMFKVIKFLPLNILESAGLFNEKIYKQNITGMVAWLRRQ